MTDVPTFGENEAEEARTALRFAYNSTTANDVLFAEAQIHALLAIHAALRDLGNILERQAGVTRQ